MKKVLFLIASLLILGLILSGCNGGLLPNVGQTPATTQGGISYPVKGDPVTTNLIADGGSPESAITVGEVNVWDDGSNLCVEYLLNEDAIADGWLLTETHLAVATSSDGIPHNKKGNPIPGQFLYGDDELDYVESYQECIPLSYIGTDLGTVYIAAHAVVCHWVGTGVEVADLAGIEASLPDQVTFKVTYPYPGGLAYFPHVYINGLSTEQLDVYGWCVDTGRFIYQDPLYTANVYSSYETLPTDLIESTENLDLVNWILNQYFVGQSSACGGIYTYGDVQRAIWELIEDGQSTSGLGDWSQCRVDEILAAANANGEGFEPGCGDIIAVILAPVDENSVNNAQVVIAQVIVGEFIVECIEIEEEECETAWGEGLGFPGKNWAMYFNYEV